MATEGSVEGAITIDAPHTEYVKESLFINNTIVNNYAQIYSSGR